MQALALTSIKHSLLLIMQFVQLEGAQTPNYFDFYRQRFPAAFKHPQTEEEQPDWLTPAHKDAFKTFDSEIAAANKT